MFSIIMPAWNRANIIDSAIESVVAQSYSDYELLIVDDGSTDQLESVVRPFRSEKIFYYRIPHSGASAARNFGILHAHQDFIAYLDADNIWHPDFLERMHLALQQHSDYQVAYCRFDVYRQDRATSQRCLAYTGGVPFNWGNLLTANYIDMNTFVHARRCIKYAGLHDESLRRLLDWEFILNLAKKYQFLFVPEILVDYYLGCQTNTITFTEDVATPMATIKRRNRMHTQPIQFVHDAIHYSWENVADEKYHNWTLMNSTALNTTDYTAWGFPYMLQIEPTSLCNLACPLCPTGRRELNRPYRHMQLGEFQSLIDDMHRYLLFLVLWDWGEPLMNPDLPAMVRYASERGIKTVTSTNGHFLNNDSYVEALLKSGLTTLIVAVDSITEDYTTYRKKGELDRVLAGLNNVIAVKKRLGAETLINMRTVVMKQNEHELEACENYARMVGADCFTVKTLNPSCGMAALDESLLPRNPSYRRYQYYQDTWDRVRIDTTCRRVWIMANIFSNGDVVPCCYDYSSEMKVGNIGETPLTKLWNSPAYCALRKRIVTQMSSIPRCHNCDINFKLSESGWFVKSVDLAAERKQNAFVPWSVTPTEQTKEIQRLRVQLAAQTQASEQLHAQLIAQTQANERLRVQWNDLETSIGWKTFTTVRQACRQVIPLFVYLWLKHRIFCVFGSKEHLPK